MTVLYLCGISGCHPSLGQILLPSTAWDNPLIFLRSVPQTATPFRRGHCLYSSSCSQAGLLTYCLQSKSSMFAVHRHISGSGWRGRPIQARLPGGAPITLQRHCGMTPAQMCNHPHACVMKRADFSMRKHSSSAQRTYKAHLTCVLRLGLQTADSNYTHVCTSTVSKDSTADCSLC